MPESCLESGVPLRALSPFLGDRGGEAIELRRPGFLANPSRLDCRDIVESVRGLWSGVPWREKAPGRGERSGELPTSREALLAASMEAPRTLEEVAR